MLVQQPLSFFFLLLPCVAVSPGVLTHHTFSFITPQRVVCVQLLSQMDSNLYWLLKPKFLPRIDEKNEAGFKVTSWEIGTTLVLNFICIPLWRKHSDGIVVVTFSAS